MRTLKIGDMLGFYGEWPKPNLDDGYSRHGWVYTEVDAAHDTQRANNEARLYHTGWQSWYGKHADFHWKMDNPPRGVTVD